MRNIIESWVKQRGKLHFTLIDPDRQTPEDAAKLALTAQENGSDAIMAGGSTAGIETVDRACKSIKEAVDIPIILFPSGSAGVTKHADYIFFMSLLNSKRRRYLVEEQLLGAPLVKKLGITPIPMGYLLISTSREQTTVEKVADPDIIRASDIEKAKAYALTAQYFGMHCVYLEAGSGADKPVPPQMVEEVKGFLEVPLIVGGGMRDPVSAEKAAKAGADAIVTGTIGERDTKTLADIIRKVKGLR